MRITRGGGSDSRPDYEEQKPKSEQLNNDNKTIIVESEHLDGALARNTEQQNSLGCTARNYLPKMKMKNMYLKSQSCGLPLV